MRSALEPIAALRVAYLFGSRAHGRERDDSDLDVAVAYERTLDLAGREEARREVLSALTEVLGSLGERADVIDLHETDSAVAFRAISEGIRVLSRSAHDRVATEVSVARRYDDDGYKRALFERAAVRIAERWKKHG